MKKTVLITGARGIIGEVLREALEPKYNVRALSRKPIPGVETITTDIADLPSLIEACQGVDSIIHLAASASPWSTWDEVLHSNITGVYNVYEAAHKAGVKQVIFASSNHALGNYEPEAEPDIYRTGLPLLDHNVPVRPDSLYGVSKCFGEAMGRFYAESKGLHVICLRIGFTNRDNRPPQNLTSLIGHVESPERLSAIWISQRDMVQLHEKCLEADHVQYAILYGISNNQPHFYDLEYARELVGYEPQDGADVNATLSEELKKQPLPEFGIKKYIP